MINNALKFNPRESREPRRSMPPYPSGRGPGSVSVAGRQIKSYLSYRRSMPLRDRPHEDPCEVSAPAKSTTAVPAALQAGGRDCDCAVPSSYLSVSDTDSVESRPRLGAGPARSLYTAVTGRTVCLYLAARGRPPPVSSQSPHAKRVRSVMGDSDGRS